jgi:hypothetical protein
MYRFTDEFWDFPPDPGRQPRKRRRPDPTSGHFTFDVLNTRSSRYWTFCNRHANVLLFVVKFLIGCVLSVFAIASIWVMLLLIGAA